MRPRMAHLQDPVAFVRFMSGEASTGSVRDNDGRQIQQAGC